MADIKGVVPDSKSVAAVPLSGGQPALGPAGSAAAPAPASAAAPAPAANSNTPWAADSRYAGFIRRKELTPKVAQDLYRVLNSCNIVLLCDDSGSMAQAIAEAPAPGQVPSAAGKTTTRWQELKRLAAILIEMITLTNPEGLDLFFMNRQTLRGVKDVSGLQAAFAADPSGGTPLLTSLNTIMTEHSTGKNAARDLLIVVVTDGQPSDGSKEDLFRLLKGKPSNVHVSLAECTDEEETMRFLDEWDGQIPGFDNTDDYREELRRVKAAQGAAFKFDFNDYAIKILLATFIRSYFNLDQNGANPSCCTIL